ncbi:MAG: transcriptional repressor [Gammaproteobacteria bacterium]|nr:transcriptional repressor [Gammaproteobacteria bacterium]
MDQQTVSQADTHATIDVPASTPSTGRITPARQAVIEILNGTRLALTHHEIERQARANGIRFDRVTLYRALDWLVANGIAHKVAAEDRVWRFNSARANQRYHAHFHCKECGTVHCVDFPNQEISIPLPADFKAERTEIMLRGTCASCAG